MGGMSIFEPESLAIFLGPILLNHLNVLKTMLWGALLVATNLLNTCIYIYIFSFLFFFIPQTVEGSSSRLSNVNK